MEDILGRQWGDFVCDKGVYCEEYAHVACAWCGWSGLVALSELVPDARHGCPDGGVPKYDPLSPPSWLRDRMANAIRVYGKSVAPKGAAATAKELWLTHGPIDRTLTIARHDTDRPYSPDNVYITDKGSRYADHPRPVTSSSGNYKPRTRRVGDYKRALLALEAVR